MYPQKDFKYLIGQSGTPEDVLIRAMGREPFPEILNYWSLIHKPAHLLPIYRQGIENGISRDRYPSYQLYEVEFYPEFWSSVVTGLKRLWLSMRFSLQVENLLIDMINGRDIGITSDDRLQILDLLPHQTEFNIIVDNEPKTINVLISKQAEEIYKLVAWLKTLL